MRLELIALEPVDLSVHTSPAQVAVELIAAANVALSVGEASPTIVLEFAAVLKGDKGDKGDAGEPEFFDYDRLVAATIL